MSKEKTKEIEGLISIGPIASKLVGVIVLIGIIIMTIWARYETNRVNRTRGVHIPQEEVTVIIQISKTEWSDVIDTSKRAFSFGTPDDKVPLICRYNDGPSRGGWDEQIPARKDWNRLGWSPKIHQKKGGNARFMLAPNAPMEQAQLHYTLTPVN